MNFINNESIIAQYIDTFYTQKERDFVNSDLEVGFSIEAFKKDFSSKAWLDIEAKYKNLLPYTNLNDFHLEVADRGSYFIRKIFDKYVDEDTFVIYSSFEHPNVLKEIEKVKHKKCLFYHEITSFDFETILDEFYKSNCNQVFVYVPGTSVCTGQIIPQRFYSNIKTACDKHNIKVKLMCDDVHGMFITPRNYSIFDFILYTCHSYIPGFDMGMLWSKESETLGFTNTDRAELYYSKLNLFLSKFDKVRLFPILLTEYFAEELADSTHLDLYTNTTPHIFALKTKGLVFNQAYYDKCNEYRVELGETKAYVNFIRMRIQEFVLKDSSFILNGLQIIKDAIKSFKKKAEMYENGIVFDNTKNINQKITEHILFED